LEVPVRITITEDLIKEMFWEVLALFGVLAAFGLLAVAMRLSVGKW
jgi:hypothetical protein